MPRPAAAWQGWCQGQVSRVDLRTRFRRALAQYLPVDHTERGHRDAMLHLLAERADCFERTCFAPGHFTASALLLSADGESTLLTHHRFLDRWLQFGGHCDGDSDVLRAALREAEEESGIAGIIPVSADFIDLDVHPIPANPKRSEPPHAHFDVRFLLRAPAAADFRVSDESHALRWFTSAEATTQSSADPGLARLMAKWQARQRQSATGDAS